MMQYRCLAFPNPFKKFSPWSTRRHKVLLLPIGKAWLSPAVITKKSFWSQLRPDFRMTIDQGQFLNQIQRGEI